MIRDFNTAVAWDVRDVETIRRRFQLIQALTSSGNIPRANELASAYETKANRIIEGQYTMPHTIDDPEPLEVVTAWDLLTNIGMSRIVALVIGIATARMTHMAEGSGTSFPNGGNTSLDSEVGRMPLVTNGFATAAGTVMRFGATFLQTFPSHVVAESGVVDAASFGTFLNRTLYRVDKRINHTENLDATSLTLAIYCTSV